MENESPHDRLNRELARMQVRSVGFWGGWAVLFLTVGTFAALTFNTPTDARYVAGIAGNAQPALSESGTYVLLQVEVEGQSRTIRLPSALVHPAKGETICLRAGTRRLTGGTSYVSVPDHLCEGLATPAQVD